MKIKVLITEEQRKNMIALCKEAIELFSYVRDNLK